VYFRVWKSSSCWGVTTLYDFILGDELKVFVKAIARSVKVLRLLVEESVPA
jgi:hypothetical protein